MFAFKDVALSRRTLMLSKVVCICNIDEPIHVVKLKCKEIRVKKLPDWSFGARIAKDNRKKGILKCFALNCLRNSKNNFIQFL